MVIKSFEPAIIQPPTSLFRGRESYFWKRKIFKDIEPYDFVSHHDSPSANQGLHFLIVFDPHRFLIMEPEGVDEIIAYLSQWDPEQELIFSITGTPFFVVSSGMLKKLGLRFKEDRELAARWRNNKNVRMIHLTRDEGVEVLDVDKHLKRVEDAVIDYQIKTLTANGVMIEDLGHFFIEGLVPIGVGTRISSGVVIKGDSNIGKDVHLYPHVYIENSIIGDHCIVLPGSIVRDSVLEEHVQIGPYTHLRSGALVKKGAKMGNFVEMKQSVLGEGSKSMHLTYIGDAKVGKDVNIGAGTITCNYDGVRKLQTIIEDGVFIGSGTELVAPVVIEKNSYIGAGSTITEQVPQNALAVARHKQRTLLDWVTRKRGKKVGKPRQ
ncbi:MAG: DapH/DapD/GlmU-related protein [Candidatus Aminicenantes bacterium]|jgi:bifunctional UDP-N-acetylglucosamine pyrophosphorylase/glucosamine-1-phosphate N-acetyltransferase